MIKMDDKKYVNEEDAMKAMHEELKKFEDKSNGEINLIIGLTIMSFISTLFKEEDIDG